MDSFYKTKKAEEQKRSYFGFLKRRAAGSNGTNSILNANYDKKLVYSLSKSRIPSLRQFKYVKKYLNHWELFVVRICITMIIISSLFLGGRYVAARMELVPVIGGSYIEGLIGYPKNINPLYSNISDVDGDIGYLIYSSLFKRDGNGQLIKDLVEDYGVSEDGKTYTFKIRQDAKWHDGSNVTLDDILFTINAIKDPNYKSTLRQSFTGVVIEKIDETSFKLTLSEPYAAFLDVLVFGILPQELWTQIPPDTASLAELNIKPIGSGPYKFKSLAKDKSGVIKSYTLEVNQDYYGQVARIEEIIFKFYNSATEAVMALNQGEIEGMGYLPKQEEESIKNIRPFNIFKLNLPQISAIFFNLKSDKAIADKKVRQALAYAINKNELVGNNIQDAQRIDGPIMPDSFAYYQEIKKYDYNVEQAEKLLDEAGWKSVEVTKEMIDKANSEIQEGKNEEANRTIIELGEGKWRQKDGKYLILELASVDRTENAEMVEIIKGYWEAIGIKTSISLLTSSDVQSNLIKSRSYDILLYGQVIGSDPDPYAFWHSSQSTDPGLNITGFSDKDIDKILEEARMTSDVEARKERYKTFQEKIVEDVPAIFLFSKQYTYLQAKKVNGFNVTNISMPYDRFNNISDWYIKTAKKINFFDSEEQPAE